MGKVELWFPIGIYQERELFSSDQNNQWAEYALSIKDKIPSQSNGWQGNTYTTHAAEYVLKTDPVFAPLINKITEHVNYFAKQHGDQSNYSCQHAWLNIADEGNSQEFHTHNGSIFSLAYYITAPEGSGRIIFEDPKEPDMMPLKGIGTTNDLSFTRIGYAPEQGFLLIFRSYMRHMVESGFNKTPRISISMNFG